ncbi:hypothetical protein HAX54_002862, partial [Datura stramonium]|nr:hypothetical protein [Datura stramonium]
MDISRLFVYAQQTKDIKMVDRLDREQHQGLLHLQPMHCQRDPGEMSGARLASVM